MWTYNGGPRNQTTCATCGVGQYFSDFTRHLDHLGNFLKTDLDLIGLQCLCWRVYISCNLPRQATGAGVTFCALFTEEVQRLDVISRKNSLLLCTVKKSTDEKAVLLSIMLAFLKWPSDQQHEHPRGALLEVTTLRPHLKIYRSGHAGDGAQSPAFCQALQMPLMPQSRDASVRAPGTDHGYR